MAFKPLPWIIVCLGICLGLTACQPGLSFSLFGQAGTPASVVTLTPFQFITPTARPVSLAPTLPADPTPLSTLAPTLTPTPLPSPTTPPCQERTGKIERQEVTFETSSQPFIFRVYTPPCFNTRPPRHYPVLYMIHGQTFNDDQWERLGIGPAADSLINEQVVPPFLIVMPLEKDTYADIYLESFGREVPDDLVPWIDAHYPTCAERACRAIGGLSRGGAWSLRLGFTHWDLFSAIGLHSTPPFNTDPGLFPSWVQKIPADKMPRVYMDIGRRDPFLSMATDFEAQLVQYSVPHEWYLFNGTHEEAYWSAHVAGYLEWYARPWKELSLVNQGG